MARNGWSSVCNVRGVLCFAWDYFGVKGDFNMHESVHSLHSPSCLRPRFQSLTAQAGGR